MAPFALFSLLNAPVSRHPGKIFRSRFHKIWANKEKDLIRLMPLIYVGGCVPSHVIWCIWCVQVFSFFLAKQHFFMTLRSALLCLLAASDSCGSVLGETAASPLKPLTASFVCAAQVVWYTACVWCVRCGSRAVVCTGLTRSPCWLLSLIAAPLPAPKIHQVFLEHHYSGSVFFSWNHVRYFGYRCFWRHHAPNKTTSLGINLK